jgi:signal transduction histidine kinase
MGADTLDKLFDPFFTTKRGSGGSGLGAHILYNLVTGSLGGSLRAESSPGKGLQYHLRFPRKTKKAELALA